MGKRAPEREGLRAVGLGLITGAADDDPSAIGTYASAGAALGPSVLWTAPVMFPMMFAVVYLSSKLGQASGRGLFEVIHDCFPRWILWTTLALVLFGNSIEAAADLGGMAAGLELLVPLPHLVAVIVIATVIVTLQIVFSYRRIRNLLRWLALVLLAYIGAAVLARPDLHAVARGTLVPHLRLDRQSLAFLVAIIGTSLSAYLYTWQSNEEVEEKIARGITNRVGTTNRDLRRTRRDIVLGMAFSAVIMYFVMLSTATTIHPTEIASAADAARALEPIAGHAAGLLFTLGIVAVGLIALPVMTAGAAYDLCQTVGWKHGLYMKFDEAPRFYIAIIAFTAVGVALNALGVNPIRALVWAGIVQGFSTPPLLFLIMRMTNRRTIMGEHVNTRRMNVLGWVTTSATFAATAGLVVTWLV